MRKTLLAALAISATTLSLAAQTGQANDSLMPPPPQQGGQFQPGDFQPGQFQPGDSLMPDSLRRMGPPPGGGQGGPGGMPPGGMRPDGQGGPGGMPPGGQGGPGMGGPGGRNISQDSSLSEDGIGLSDGEESQEGQAYASTGTDENAVKVTGGTLTLKNCTITKPGADSNNEDGTSFYGTNAAVLANNGGTVVLDGGTITTNARGANAIVASGGTVTVSDMVISCENNLSRGIHATNGGTINAANLTISTKGNNSSVIATDRGGGTVTVNGGTYETSGGDCAVCYSTGNITVNGITGKSAKGEIGVIEGDNEINYNDCTLESGDNRRGMMILQSGSGDAVGFNGRINVTGGTMKLTSSEAPLIEVTTRTQGTVTLRDVALEVPSGVLMQVGYNSRWQTKNPVAILHLQTASACTYGGDIVVLDDGTSTVTVGNGVTWNGAYDTADTGLATTVEVAGTWNLTADSHVDKVIVHEGGVINKNGHQLVTNY